MNCSKLKRIALQWIDSNKEEFNQTADKLWAYPELAMEEQNSSAALIALLEKHNFTVQKGVAGMPTAFVATYGSGKPVIGFSAEYDGLPGLSQEIGVEQKPIISGGPGQGCGHNLIGVGGIQAAIALKMTLEDQKIPATIKVFGTPAEELCVGKPFMARAGLFQGVDIFLDWHPWNYNRADYDTCNAFFSIKYHFQGKTSHGNSPWYGRSALDAAVLQAHAAEMMREHIRPSTRGLEAANTLNYTFSDVGPEFPSIVPDRSTAWYLGRFDTCELLTEILSRLDKCAEAAAMATETTVETELITATHDKLPNKTLAEVMHKNLEEIGCPEFTADEQNFAKAMQRNAGAVETGLDETIMPFGGGSIVVTDSSEYGWFAPHSIVTIAAAPPGVGWHNWIVTSCAGSSIGKKALNTAAKVLAATAIDAIINPSIIQAAQQELKETLANRQFVKLLPDSVNPPLNINTATMNKYR